MESLSTRVVGIRLNTQSYCHSAIGIGREVIGRRFSAGYGSKGAGEADEEGALEDEVKGEDPLEL